MKTDFKKDLKHLYNPSAKTVSEVVVPAINFLMIDGQGSPGECQAYTDAIQTIFPVAYALKFAIRKSAGFDFGVLPLEGLWWADDMNDFVNGNRDNWLWTIMIMQPDVVTKELFIQTLAEVKTKKKLAAVDRIRFESYSEVRSAQLMHLGPFAAEGPNIARIHQFIQDQGGKPSGKHHEIYLSDIRKVAPEKMKTVLRQPFTGNKK